MMDEEHSLVGRSATFPLNMVNDHEGVILAFDEERSLVRIIDVMGDIWEGCESQILLGPPLELERLNKNVSSDKLI